MAHLMEAYSAARQAGNDRGAATAARALLRLLQGWDAADTCDALAALEEDNYCTGRPPWPLMGSN